MFKIQTRHIKLNEAIWTNFRYADVMCSVLNNQFGYLIASIEREVDSPGCMPYSLSFDDVKDLFGKLLHFSRVSLILAYQLFSDLVDYIFRIYCLGAFHPDFEIVNVHAYYLIVHAR